MGAPIEPGFTGLFAEEFAALSTTGEIRTFAAGQRIFASGDVGDGFYIVESGLVSIAAAIGSAELRQLATIGPGDFFGEMAVLDDAPRSATATAEVETRTLFLSREQLLSLLDHRPRFALNLIREFSARVRALNKKYLDEIIQAERLATIGRFARTIVHDFKNPLTTISIAAELSGAPTTAPAMRAKAQQQIMRQIDRMTSMLNDLIDYTRASELTNVLTASDFAAFMAPLLAALREDVAPRRVTLEYAEPLPSVAIRLNPTRMARVFTNLVNNAVDAMREGGRIFVRCAVVDGALRIEVEDTGPGIAPEIAGQLFQPFATHGKAHGTGLGLSICKKITEDHGGRIWTESAPGKGATFCVTLPLAS